MVRIFLAALFVVATAKGAAAGNSCAMPANVNQLATEIAAGVNASRLSNGLAALAYNPVLGRAATAHACDMSSHAFFGHKGSNGSNINARVRSAGYAACTVAENLAWGYPTSGQIIGGWMNSAGHRSNMLHPRVKEMGIGISQGGKGPNWVLVLGRSC
jgi:uncharacterized protein YkwD